MNKEIHLFRITWNKVQRKMNKYGYYGIIQIYEPSDAIQLPKFDLIHRKNNWKDSANKSLFILDIFIKKYIS